MEKNINIINCYWADKEHGKIDNTLMIEALKKKEKQINNMFKKHKTLIIN